MFIGDNAICIYNSPEIHVMIISTKSFQEFPFDKRTASYKILHLILERSQFDGPLVSSLVETL